MTYIKFPQLLFDLGLTKQKTEKILIRLDTVAQNFNYQPVKKLLNKFDVFTQILAFDLDLLLSAKILAVLERKTAKGRDFFDIIYLLPQTKPNLAYLQAKLAVNDLVQVRERLLAYCQQLDFIALAKDVEPFVFDGNRAKQVLSFTNLIELADW